MEEEMISKNLAALELTKALKRIQVTAVMGVLFAFAPIFVQNLFLTGGLAIVIFLFILFTEIRTEKRLKKKYNL